VRRANHIGQLQEWVLHPKRPVPDRPGGSEGQIFGQVGFLSAHPYLFLSNVASVVKGGNPHHF
jgi:hypothetical protein